ncbi:MAG TPA: hypothetical protein PKG95_01170 [Anaerolineaceae bacterium]|nr:hypothetical protein [Anaerolineaceae bacterium]
MKTTLETQGAQLRCYKCGSPNITSICHHCGRPMCSHHGPVKPWLSFFVENREFSRLNLDNWPFGTHEGAHCEHHVHSTVNYRRVMIIPGIVIGIIGLIMLLAAGAVTFDCLAKLPDSYPLPPFNWAEVLRDPVWYVLPPERLPLGQCYAPELLQRISLMLAGLSVLIFGAAATVIGFMLNREKRADDIAGNRADLPISPATAGFEVIETIVAEYQFGPDGRSTTRLLDEVSGRLIPGFRFLPGDVTRISQYREKYSLDSGASLIFQAGFLALKGRIGIHSIKSCNDTKVKSPTYPERYQERLNNRIWLEGATSHHPFLTGLMGRLDPSWPVYYQYTVDSRSSTAGDCWNGVPVRVIPRLVEKGSTRTVQIEIQFNRALFPALKPADDPDARTIPADRAIFLDKATLQVDPDQTGRPVTNGMVELHTDAEGRIYNLEWQGLWMPVRDQQILGMTLPEIRFDQPVAEGACLSGELVFRIPTSWSGIEGVEYFSALGLPVPVRTGSAALQNTVYTFLVLKVQLALPKIPTTQLLSLSAPQIERRGGPIRERVDKIVQALNNDNSGSGQVYVRRVVENIPQFGSSATEKNRWAWDLSGRYYYLTYPVDYHLVIYGFGDARMGKTYLDMTVQGQVEVDGDEQSLDRRYLNETLERLRILAAEAIEDGQQEVVE